MPSHELPEDEPFRIALLGDFGGRGQGTRKPVAVDRDNFEELLQRLDAGIDLPGGRVTFRDLDDFHPDQLYATLPAFEDIRNTRARLGDPGRFHEAARDLLGERPPELPSGNLLDAIIGESTTTAAAPAKSELQDFIDAAVRPHLVPKQDPRAPELIRQVDELASGVMRAVLHHPEFKRVEAAWRTLHMLVRRLDTGTELNLYVIDVDKQLLERNIEEIYQTLLQSGPWAVIAGNYSFGSNDLRLLGLLGRIGSRLHAPFLGDADSSLLGDPQWEAFRANPEARHVGLAIPRILVRTPYGKDTNSCESFAFEEIPGEPDAKRMLFGSAAYFLAMLLGQSFAEYGWNLRPGVVKDIANLPFYPGMPCAEIELNEDTAEALIEEGMMPMAALRDRDVVRAVRFQSVASPAKPLPGRWE